MGRGRAGGERAGIRTPRSVFTPFHHNRSAHDGNVQSERVCLEMGRRSRIRVAGLLGSENELLLCKEVPGVKFPGPGCPVITMVVNGISLNSVDLRKRYKGTLLGLFILFGRCHTAHCQSSLVNEQSDVSTSSCPLTKTLTTCYTFILLELKDHCYVKVRSFP